MLRSDIQAVVFDAVGTLLHPDPAAGEAYAVVGRRLGSQLSLAEITRRFAVAFAREEELHIYKLTETATRILQKAFAMDRLRREAASTSND